MPRLKKAAYRTRDYPKHRDSLLSLLREVEAKDIAEIGVYRSMTVEFVVKNYYNELDSYYMIDAWKPFGDEKEAGCPVGEDWAFWYNHAVELAKEFRKLHVIREDSVKAAQQFHDQAFDLVFIDADHSYEAVKNDIAAWKSKVKPGGIIAGHDYYERWLGVIKAVEESFPSRSIKFLPDTVWYVVCQE